MTVSQICIHVIPVVFGMMMLCNYCKQVSDNLTSLPLVINIVYQLLILFVQVLKFPAEPILIVMLFCLALKVALICSFVNYQPLKSRGGYVYPDWSHHLGLAMALSSMVVIPIYASVKLCFAEGTLRQVRVTLWALFH